MIFTVFPPKSRVVLNAIWSPDTFPSCSGTSPCGPVMLPVSLSPSTWNVNVIGVISPPRPGTSPAHLPEMSAAATSELRNSARKQAKTVFIWVLLSKHVSGSANLHHYIRDESVPRGAGRMRRMRQTTGQRHL